MTSARAAFWISAALCTMAAPAARPTSTLTAAASDWHVEHDRPTVATLAAERGRIRLQLVLGGGHPTNQFAAVVVRAPERLETFARLVIRATADRPMRIAVQLRRRDDLGSTRWRRTMYVDERWRTATFELRDFVPVEPDAAGAPPLATIAAVMLGVDTVNTRPGTGASITFGEVRLER